jgi:uncharacterized protein YxjI
MLNLKTYLVKEHAGLFKLVDTYDIFDAATGQQVATAHEEVPGWVHALRLLVNKRLLPTTVAVYPAGSEEPLFSIHRGFTLLRALVEIRHVQQGVIGYLKAKIFSLGGGFFVLDRDKNQVAEVRGNWKGWTFKLLASDGHELGTVTKKWAGLAKEMFTSADNYVIALAEGEAQSEAGNLLLLAAGLAIDTVFRER